MSVIPWLKICIYLGSEVTLKGINRAMEMQITFFGSKQTDYSVRLSEQDTVRRLHAYRVRTPLSIALARLAC